MKITKNELKEIIREEATRFKRKIELETELSEVQSQLDEVTGGPGTHVANNTAGVMYDKNIKTKSAPGGPEALVEDGMEEEVEINIDDEVTEESYVSEEALEEILNEIMSEDDEEDTEEPEPEEDMMEGDDVVFVDDEVKVAENMMEDENMTRKKVAAEGGAQPQNESASLVSEEVQRMKQLAGIKIL